MSRFHITSHTINASHPREFPRGTTSAYSNTPVLELVVNQYVPKDYTPKEGDMSIIFCHANAFHKELYEPFFDDLLLHLQNLSIGLRAIWAPDAAHQGASGILNEHHLGDQPSWNDLARDLLHLINTFSAQLPLPIVGMGHSYGGHAVIRASLLHPSLFLTLIAIDPVIESSEACSGKLPAMASVRRVDMWPDRETAEKYFRNRKFYKTWDPRCLDAHMKHGLRELPSAAYPDGKGWTLATTKHQEVFTFMKCEGEPGQERCVVHESCGDTWKMLPEVRPKVLYIVGKESPVCTEIANKGKMEYTRSAEMVEISGVGHLVPLEKPTETAEIAAKYLQTQFAQWQKDAESDRAVVRNKLLPESYVKSLSKL